MTTLHDVARIAGVSTATVSHVINKTRRVSPATTARVQNAIAQLNFVPNPIGRLLARQKIVPCLPLPASVPPTEDSSVVDSPECATGAASLVALPSQKEQALKTISAASHETTRAMLRMVRAAQPISRADLARRLEVHRSTITEMVKPLIASGLL